MRRKDREITDQTTIDSIIRRSNVIHIAMLDGEYPYIVPMNFGYSFDGQQLRFCMHCAKEGKKLDLLRKNPSVAFELTIDNGLQEGPTPCSYGYLYECVMGRGKVRFADDPAEKTSLLRLIMLHHTGESYEFTKQHASAVEVFVIDVEELTAKAQRPKPLRV